MNKPEYIPYGEEWRKKMARLKKADIIRIASGALIQKESERKQLIDALVEVQESHVMSDGLTLISDQTKDKIKTALRDAGVES